MMHYLCFPAADKNINSGHFAYSVVPYLTDNRWAHHAVQISNKINKNAISIATVELL